MRKQLKAEGASFTQKIYNSCSEALIGFENETLYVLLIFTAL